MAKFRCTVAIPTRELFSGEIDYADVPGSDGSFGVMSGHEMLVCTNRPGILTLWLDPEGKEKLRFATFNGHSQVFENRLTVLPRMGHELDSIDFDDVRRKLEETRAEIAELEKDPEGPNAASLETHRTKLEWYEFQLSLADVA